MAWQTDILTFDKSELQSVVFDLNRKFHADISISNKEIEQCKITATFENKSLDAIVQIIEKTLNISSERKSDKTIFMGNSCQ